MLVKSNNFYHLKSSFYKLKLSQKVKQSTEFTLLSSIQFYRIQFMMFVVPVIRDAFCGYNIYTSWYTASLTLSPGASNFGCFSLRYSLVLITATCKAVSSESSCSVQALSSSRSIPTTREFCSAASSLSWSLMLLNNTWSQ